MRTSYHMIRLSVPTLVSWERWAGKFAMCDRKLNLLTSSQKTNAEPYAKSCAILMVSKNNSEAKCDNWNLRARYFCIHLICVTIIYVFFLFVLFFTLLIPPPWYPFIPCFDFSSYSFSPFFFFFGLFIFFLSIFLYICPFIKAKPISNEAGGVNGSAWSNKQIKVFRWGWKWEIICLGTV